MRPTIIALALGTSALIASPAFAWIKPLFKHNMTAREKHDLGYRLEGEFRAFNDACGVSSGAKFILPQDKFSPLPSDLQLEKISGVYLIYTPSIVVDTGQVWRTFRRAHVSNARADLLKDFGTPSSADDNIDARIFFLADRSHWRYEATCSTMVDAALSSGINAGAVSAKDAARISAKQEASIQFAYGALRSGLANSILLEQGGNWSPSIRSDYDSIWSYYVSRSKDPGQRFVVQALKGVSMTRTKSTFSKSEIKAGTQFAFSYGVATADGKLAFEDNSTTGYQSKFSTFFVEGTWDSKKSMFQPTIDVVAIPSISDVAASLSKHVQPIDRGTKQTTWGTEYATVIEFPATKNGSGVSKNVCENSWSIGGTKPQGLVPQIAAGSVTSRFEADTGSCYISIKFQPTTQVALKDKEVSDDITLKSGLFPKWAIARIEAAVNVRVFYSNDIKVSLKNTAESTISCEKFGMSGLSCEVPIVIQTRGQVDPNRLTVDTPQFQSLFKCQSNDDQPFEAVTIQSASLQMDRVSFEVQATQLPRKCVATGIPLTIGIRGGSGQGVPVPLSALEFVLNVAR